MLHAAFLLLLAINATTTSPTPYERCSDACDAATPDCTVWIRDANSPTGISGRTDDGSLCQEAFGVECNADCWSIDDNEETFDEWDMSTVESCERDCTQNCNGRSGGVGPACAISCPFICEENYEH